MKPASGARILVIEDDKSLAKVLRYNLEKEGYKVSVCHDGEAGLEAFRKEKPDLMVLDLMLPKLDGYEFCKSVRRDSPAPILMLTARKEEMDRVLGLELGADDYVTKPFSVREILARVKAILRRASSHVESALLKAGAVELDPERYEARVRGRAIALTSLEFELLKCLLGAGGRALSREDLLVKVWGHEQGLDLDTRTVDQHVKRLRDKLGTEAGRLVTVKNVGYRLRED